jgi:hypothetical protein
MLKASVPLPLPLEEPLIEIHDALLPADQSHPAVPDTDTERDAADASTLTSSGVTENVQLGSVGGRMGGVVGGTVGAELESCVMVTLRPAMVTDAERSPPLFAETASVTEPGPVPLDPDDTVTHDSSDFDVHAHPASVSTLILVLPPDAPTFWPEGDTVNWQAAAS